MSGVTVRSDTNLRGEPVPALRALLVVGLLYTFLQAVAVALAHRYLKRIVAHGMNVLSAVVMPVDRLDYFDEDPEDRS